MGKKGFDPFDHPRRTGRPPFYLVHNVVLCFDIVDFTRETTNDQMQTYIQHIQNVLNNPRFYENYYWNEKRGHNDLIMIPTGDGLAIGFHPKYQVDDILSYTADIFKFLTANKLFSIRMGLAIGPNVRFEDANNVTNLFGYGINLAFRITDETPTNRIYIHDRVVKNLLRNKEIKELQGPFSITIKGGEQINVYNYFRLNEFGSPYNS